MGKTEACQESRAEARVFLVEAERILQELKLSNALREVEFELIRLDEPDLFLLSFEEMLNRGQRKEYEFRVNEVGEYAVHSFIRKLVHNLGRSWSQRSGPNINIEVGIGDAAAVLAIPGSQEFDVVLTTDAAPGSISRSLEVGSGRYAAKFAVVHSVSDILAMGATPVALLLNLYMVRDAKLEYAIDGSKVFVPFFTDEKFVRRPYQDRVYEWEELKSYLKGSKPLPPNLQRTLQAL